MDGYELFFVKAPDGRFAAVVQRFGMLGRQGPYDIKGPDDLLCYVSGAYRRKNILVAPMQRVILPFIFAKYNTPTQRATVDPDGRYAKYSMRLARKIGFQKVGELEDKHHIYEISRENARDYVEYTCDLGRLDELDELKEKVQTRIRVLQMAVDVLKVKYHKHVESQKIDRVSEAVGGACYRLCDALKDAVRSMKADSTDQGHRVTQGQTPLLTNAIIRSILRRTNNDIIRQIGTNVKWGFIWGSIAHGFMPRGKLKGNELFFIKAPDGRYAAAVERFGPWDLRCYVSRRDRDKHIFAESIKTVILPFIFENYDWPTQETTVGSDCRHKEYSTRLLRAIGFQQVRESEEKHHVYEISRENVPPYVEFPCDLGHLDELDRLKRRVQTSIRVLRMANDALEVKYSTHCPSGKIEQSTTAVDEAGYLLVDTIVDAEYSLKAKSPNQQAPPS